MPSHGQCSVCGKAIFLTWSSSKTPTCMDCIKARPTYRSAADRRKRGGTWEPELRSCKTCSSEFMAKRATQVYCNPDCRPGTAWREKARNPKKYGPAHARARKKWAAALEMAGFLPCSICREPVVHGTTWHLDHVPDSDTEYRGVAHPSCNISDGAKRGVQIANRSPKRRQRDSIPLTLASGRTVDVSMRACESCGKTCFGRRCRTCVDVERAAKRQPEPQRALLAQCVDCGCFVNGRAIRCSGCRLAVQRSAARDAYRRRVGIPLDAPIVGGRPRSREF